MNRSLTRLSLRHFQRHPWQAALALLGVSLGVAVVVSIEAANGSALAAFELSTEALVGRATHQIASGSSGVPDQLFAELRSAGVRPSAPVVEGRVLFEQASGAPPRVLNLLGVDPLTDRVFRDYAAATSSPGFELADFLTRPGAVVLEEQAAGLLSLAPGDRFEVRVGANREELEVLATFRVDDPSTRSSLTNLLVTDIATAQETLDFLGRLSRIDLMIGGQDAGVNAEIDHIRKLLPPSTSVRPSSTRADEAAEMTRSFRLNLRALSLLAILCGAFLIYNTMTFAVIQRRHELGTLRALGVTRAQILLTVLGEASLIGVVGTILGVVAGRVLAARLLAQVTQTINDHYFVVSVRDVELPASTLAVGFLLGVGASILGALSPALEAVAAAPRASLQRSEIEDRVRQALPRITLTGAFLAMAGTGLLLWPGPLSVAFTGFFLLLLGLACFIPVATLALVRLLTPAAAALAGGLGRIAARGVAASMSRTAIAIAALTVAVSVSIGVDLMIRSFRSTVDSWLTASLPADLYVSLEGAPVDRFSVRPPGLGKDFLARIARVDGIDRVNTVRGVEVNLVTEQRGRRIDIPTRLLAYDLDRRGREAIVIKEGDPVKAWEAVDAGQAVLASEPLAYRYDLVVGSQIELETPTGLLPLRVAAIHYDYASERGAVLVDASLYERNWGDPLATAASIYLVSEGRETERVDVDVVAEAIRAEAARANGMDVLVRSNRVLRALSLEVFDRTFVVTRVLRFLAILVAAVGILSALTALQLERIREIGVLRANGLTPGQVWALVVSETGLMGLIAGILALPLGWVIAVVMIQVINRRSFGWTMAMEVDPLALLGAMGLALGAAITAGLYPAYRMAKIPPAEALRGR
ncbi:MAG: ABC transporter permease [Acidobacteriota bacterium]|nr:ABC transporter permease [Acidobacteriota bacterium]